MHFRQANTLEDIESAEDEAASRAPTQPAKVGKIVNHQIKVDRFTNAGLRVTESITAHKARSDLSIEYRILELNLRNGEGPKPRLPLHIGLQPSFAIGHRPQEIRACCDALPILWPGLTVVRTPTPDG
jgi:hypothetical protein